MRDIGQSLGNIASFMHEMESSFGLDPHRRDPRGIERMQMLAARLQQASKEQNKL